MTENKNYLEKIKEYRNLIDKHYNDLIKKAKKNLDNQTFEKFHSMSKLGKRVRSIFLILLDEALQTERKRNKKHLKNIVSLCLIIETIHFASLIHDDIIDNEKIRRNEKTINEDLGNEIAVILGDFAMSESIQKTIELNTSDKNKLKIIEKLSNAIKNLTIGEIKQLKNKGEIMKIKDYEDISNLKTGSLFGLCCEFVSIINNIGSHKKKLLFKLGEIIGTAFQTENDYQDYKENKMSDFRQQISTIPLYLLLKKVKKDHKKRIISLFKDINLRSSETNDYILKLFKDNKINLDFDKIKEKYKKNSHSILKKLKINNENIKRFISEKIFNEKQ